eukprot:TRINITY_DN57657_c0_g1_i1.p1 TRINITY_DN57657_c0_g1~~TRINITY_DN57657_c0_g1_i1.p1  ORF type:complete len:235 (-),score=31.86 TRINITY_DN57657_c0_g1_i1:255-932(-)
MDERARGVLTCKVFSIDGRQVTVKAKATRRVWQLKKRIRRELRVPEYEQVLLYEDVRLCCNDCLCDISSGHNTQQVTLFLVRRRRPSDFSRREASELWQFFIALSPDDGDTIHGVDVPRVARFADMLRESMIIARAIAIPERITFIDVLLLLGSVRLPEEPRTSWRPTEEEDVRQYWKTDLGGRLSNMLASTRKRTGGQTDEKHETDESDESDDSDESESDEESE